MTPPSTDTQTFERALEQLSSQASMLAGLHEELSVRERRSALITVIVGGPVSYTHLTLPTNREV